MFVICQAKSLFLVKYLFSENNQKAKSYYQKNCFKASSHLNLCTNAQVIHPALGKYYLRKQEVEKNLFLSSWNLQLATICHSHNKQQMQKWFQFNIFTGVKNQNCVSSL